MLSDDEEEDLLNESSLSINFADSDELDFPIPIRQPTNEPSVTGTVYEQTVRLFKSLYRWVFIVLKHESRNVLDIIQTSKGRDKVFGTIQYILDFYVKCMNNQHQSTPY